MFPGHQVMREYRACAKASFIKKCTNLDVDGVTRIIHETVHPLVVNVYPCQEYKFPFLTVAQKTAL